MNIKWHEKIPIIFKCPKCKNYLNLAENAWQYIIPKIQDQITDSHVCPKCGRAWRILMAHVDAF